MDHFQLLWVVLFISVPEIMLIINLGLCLISEKINRKKMGLFGLGYGMICYLIMLWVPFGIHSFLLLFCSYLLLHFIGGLNYRKCLVAILLGFAIYIGIECIYTFLFIAVTGLSMLKVMDSFFLRLVHFIPEAFVLLAMIHYCRKNDFFILNKNNLSQ